MARLFSEDWLNELKMRCDVIDIISRYVPLKKQGREFIGCCPFHHEKTPSFFVYPETQSYHCFGCKESGDVIKFVQKYDNLGFIDAVERLAGMANLPMPELQDRDQGEIVRKKQEKDLMLKALKEAGIYYFKNLYSNHPQAKVALEYINKRQIKPEFVKKFGLGCSLDYDGLIKHLNSKGFNNDILRKAGLLSESNGRIFDPFGKRLTFPIFNKEGEVIGFSARLLEDRDLAKYKNTTATPVFNKSEVIFGINLLKKVREELRKENNEFDGFLNVIIVEGQIDVISMHQNGFSNCVACLGTAITPMHTRRLKQFSENIILLLDGDGAGVKATLRSIDVLRSGGLNVKVASLPKGMDPDEFLKANGPIALNEILEQAIDGMEYKIKVLADNYDLSDLTQKAKFVREALVVIKALEEQSEQDIYLELVRKFSGTPVEILRIDLGKLTEREVPYWEREEDNSVEAQEQEVVVETKKDGYSTADLFIIASLLYNKEYTHNFVDKILEMEFYDEGLVEAFEFIKNSLNSNMRPSISGLYSFMEVDKSSQSLRDAVNFEFLPDPFPEITFESYVYKNLERKLRKKLDKVQARCRCAVDKQVRDDALREVIELNKELNEIKLEIEKLNSKYTANMNLNNKKQRR